MYKTAPATLGALNIILIEKNEGKENDNNLILVSCFRERRSGCGMSGEGDKRPKVNVIPVD